VLWFDDVQWADPSTTDLIAYVARRLSGMRIMIIATCRQSALALARHPFLPLTQELAVHGECRVMVPTLLDDAAVERYVAAQFPEHTFPAGFARVIARRTEGNPLFMADLLRDLRQRQILRQQNGTWALVGDLTALERAFPESVRSLIQGKMDALEEKDRRLLAAAAIQGMDFDSAVLASVLQLDEEDVEDAFERLEREHALIRFIEEAETTNRALTLRYRFAHHVYHQAFVESVRATRRVALSRAIAERLVARACRKCDQPSTSIRRRSPRRSCTRTMTRRGSRSVGSTFSSTSPTHPSARPRSSICR
jgi:predicted ATPase